MIQLEKIEVVGWEAAVRGMRNSMNSWGKSDSRFQGEDGDYYNLAGDTWPEATDSKPFYLGSNDHDLAMRLAYSGPSESKFRRMTAVYVDITAPLYWWKEFDTYKVGTVANSCSTMHSIHEKEFELEDFSHEHLINEPLEESEPGKIVKLNVAAKDMLEIMIGCLNAARNMYLKTKDKTYWWQMIQLLPSSYNQKRTVMLNYEVLAAIYQQRRNHKLDEWRKFCRWIEGLPYSELITCGDDNDK